jgi:hypothetical protein
MSSSFDPLWVLGLDSDIGFNNASLKHYVISLNQHTHTHYFILVIIVTLIIVCFISS